MLKCYTGALEATGTKLMFVLYVTVKGSVCTGNLVVKLHVALH